MGRWDLTETPDSASDGDLGLSNRVEESLRFGHAEGKVPGPRTRPQNALWAGVKAAYREETVFNDVSFKVETSAKSPVAEFPRAAVEMSL